MMFTGSLTNVYLNNLSRLGHVTHPTSLLSSPCLSNKPRQCLQPGFVFICVLLRARLQYTVSIVDALQAAAATTTTTIKAHSHQARLRPSTSVDARLRSSTRVDGRRRPSMRVYADMEHMLKNVRVHTKRVYVRRRA